MDIKNETQVNTEIKFPVYQVKVNVIKNGRGKSPLAHVNLIPEEITSPNLRYTIWKNGEDKLRINTGNHSWYKDKVTGETKNLDDIYFRDTRVAKHIETLIVDEYKKVILTEETKA